MSSFLLIPGAGGDGWYWHLVVGELNRRGHDALAVDLPAADDSAGLGAYADAVVAAAAQCDGLIVVAQSLGGLTAPLVCARLPVDLLVLVNAMVPRPGETGGTWWESTGHAMARYEQAAREGRELGQDGDLEDAFFHDVPPDVKAEAWSRGAPEQSGRPLAEPWPLPAWPDVPTRVLAGRDDRFFPVEFQRRIAAERLGLEVEEMPGGHLLALSRPRELTDRLEAYASG